MLPVHFPESNFVFGKPKSMTDEQCSSLSVWRGETTDGMPCIISRWQPSREDIEAIKRGDPLFLSVTGYGMPPVAIFTENPFVNISNPIP